MKAPDALFIERHELARADAARRRDILWSNESSGITSVRTPGDEPMPDGRPEWDDTESSEPSP
jgi:hypothetical protein